MIMLSLETPANITHILLANDDSDQCLMFMNALENLNIPYIFTLAENGAMLLNMLDEMESLPDMIFINESIKGISEKNCLAAIRMSKRLNEVSVIVYSTSVNYPHINYFQNVSINSQEDPSSFAPNLNSFLQTVLQLPLSDEILVTKEEFLKKIILS